MQIRHLAVIASFVVLVSPQVFGQARVVEAGGASNAGQASGNNDLVVSLYNQLEALQEEVQTLRGLVEEQGNQLRRMETEQRDRYLDLDQRLIELNSATPGVGALPAEPGAATAIPPAATLPSAGQGQNSATAPAGAGIPASPSATAGLPSNNAPSVAAPSASTPPSSPPTFRNPNAPADSTTVIGAGSTSPQDEQELYRSALKLLVEENKYDESIRMFQTYIDAFPQGRLLTNTLYWQGEAYLLVSAFPQAEAVFTRLLTEFPQDPKAAGAMLKLGKAYEGMGDSDKAEQVWQQLPSRYPESANEIRLARDYLNQ